MTRAKFCHVCGAALVVPRPRRGASADEIEAWAEEPPSARCPNGHESLELEVYQEMTEHYFDILRDIMSGYVDFGFPVNIPDKVKAAARYITAWIKEVEQTDAME